MLIISSVYFKFMGLPWYNRNNPCRHRFCQIIACFHCSLEVSPSCDAQIWFPFEQMFSIIMHSYFNKDHEEKKPLYVGIHNAVGSEWHIFFFKMTKIPFIQKCGSFLSYLLCHLQISILWSHRECSVTCFYAPSSRKWSGIFWHKVSDIAQLHKVATAAVSKCFPGTTDRIRIIHIIRLFSQPFSGVQCSKLLLYQL